MNSQKNHKTIGCLPQMLTKTGQNRAEWILKGFLNRCPPNKRESLEHLLPEAEQILLSELPIYQIGEAREDSNFFEKIHWSWFLSSLKSQCEKEQKLLLAALDSTAAVNLSKELAIPLPKHPLLPLGKKFMQEILFSTLLETENQLLPIEFLPQTPLNQLLVWTKKELIELIDHLSIYDLAAELRQIVETKILKKIYSFLSDEQKKLLKTVMNQPKELFAIPRLGLDRWDGTEESFRHLLHRRGLARLAAGLAGQHEDLIWYICHQLDTGRGNALLKLLENERVSELNEAVLIQIEAWLKLKNL